MFSDTFLLITWVCNALSVPSFNGGSRDAKNS